MILQQHRRVIFCSSLWKCWQSSQWWQAKIVLKGKTFHFSDSSRDKLCFCKIFHISTFPAKNKVAGSKCDRNKSVGWGNCVTLVCIIADKQRVTDALEPSPHTKGCSGVVRDGNVPVWHRRTSNYPAWRPLPLSHPMPPSKNLITATTDNWALLVLMAVSSVWQKNILGLEKVGEMTW